MRSYKTAVIDWLCARTKSANSNVSCTLVQNRHNGLAVCSYKLLYVWLCSYRTLITLLDVHIIFVCSMLTQNSGEPTSHMPEVILNNFNTRLGLSVGRLLASLFPHDPQFHGRRVVTFHNQRDYIFFRHHRCVTGWVHLVRKLIVT